CGGVSDRVSGPLSLNSLFRVSVLVSGGTRLLRRLRWLMPQDTRVHRTRLRDPVRTRRVDPRPAAVQTTERKRNAQERTAQHGPLQRAAGVAAALPTAVLATGCDAASVNGTTAAELGTAAAAALAAAAWALVAVVRRTTVRPLLRDRERV